MCVCRIEGNQMEDRSMNKMWLVRHLEVTRQLVLEDLRVARVSTIPRVVSLNFKYHFLLVYGFKLYVGILFSDIV